MSVKIEIKSRPGLFITVDEEVAEKVGHWGWCLNNRGYVFAHIPGSGDIYTTGKRYLLSHAVFLVMTGKLPEKGQEVDHLNHDIYDNRMKNLHLGTRSDNMRNRLKRTGKQFRWVHHDKRDGSYTGGVHLFKEKKDIFIKGQQRKGTSIEDAARCGDCIAYLIGGFYKGIFNFPDESFVSKWHGLTQSNRDKITARLYEYGFLNNATRMLVQVAA
jgi:hypothetical protein